MFLGLSNLLRFGGSPMSQPIQPMPVRMPFQYPSAAFNVRPLGGIQPSWGSNPQMFNGALRPQPFPMPAPTPFPQQFNSQINFGAHSQMRPARPGY